MAAGEQIPQLPSAVVSSKRIIRSVTSTSPHFKMIKHIESREHSEHFARS
jgi:hypothetical protein